MRPTVIMNLRLLRNVPFRRTYVTQAVGFHWNLLCGNRGLCERQTRSISHLSRRQDTQLNRRQSVLFFTVGLGLGLALYESCKEYFSRFFSVKALDVTGRSSYNFIADVVEKTGHAVVYIEILDKRRLDFFSGTPATVSNGSGFIVREDGLILTNAHVVMARPSSQVQVKLYDGTVYPGVIEDVDMKHDLATVRVKVNRRLPVLKLGDSSRLRPGEWVVAMGSPLSLSNTITAGVISTVHRTSQELKLYGRDMDYIQTDAAITFGNSGGPLVNLEGEAIGINSMKVTAGISFAIPIDYAKTFLRDSDKNRKGISPKFSTNPKRYMGITMLSLTPEIIRELQMRKQIIGGAVTHGVLVWRVAIGSPAHSAGLVPGDVVTHINGEPVKGANTIYEHLEGSDVLKMRVFRRDKVIEINVVPDLNDSQ